jgi:CRISPR type II-A/NMEMI-associated protein Csn2
MEFHHADIQNSFAFAPGDIWDLTIENPTFYYEFVKSLIDDESEKISLFEGDKVLSLEKNAIVITDLFNLDPNNKKVLSAIYKKIERSHLSVERQAEFDEINRKISALMTEIASDFEGGISFNDSLALPQVLGLIDFKFDFDDSSFLTSLVSYIKAWREAIDLRLVVTLNLFPLLKSEEIALFKTEISYLGISLLNVSTNHVDLSKENIQSLTVDSDLCLIG